jgi:hypothetical protein
MSPNIHHADSSGNPRAEVTYSFDKVAFRTKKWLSAKDMKFLARNSYSVNQRRGRPLRNDDRWALLTTVCPNLDARRLTAELDDTFVNYVELAADISTSTSHIAREMVDVCDAHFVQSWHGQDEVFAEENGSYTRRNRPGIRFVWYGDRRSKVTHRPCLHIEARAHGAGAVRRIGIECPRDLVHFRHDEFWQRHLTFYSIDYERLGRWYENRRLGERRREPHIVQSGQRDYKSDLRIGTTLYRKFAETEASKRFSKLIECSDPEVEEQPDNRLIRRSVQKFVDEFGRGPFIRLFDILCYVEQSNLLNDTENTQ